MLHEMTYSDYHEVIAWELRDAIKRYFTTWETILEKPQSERELWTKAIEQRRLTVVILSSALLECAINFYLCTKCSAKRFKLIEKDKRLGSLYLKCTEAPKEFRKSYSVPAGSDLAKDFRKLIDRRKGAVHPKPMMSIDGDNRHKGNEPNLAWDEHEFIGRCATLPFRLVEQLIGDDGNDVIELFSLRTCCGAVAHQFKAGQRRLEVRANVPKALLAEIMEQGHDRETAFRCVFRMGSNPTPDDDGHIKVWMGGKKFIRLKPLKYFAKVNV
jgi:hypothetical protein